MQIGRGDYSASPSPGRISQDTSLQDDVPPSTPTSHYIPYSDESSLADEVQSEDSSPPQTPPAIPVMNAGQRPQYDDFGDLTEMCHRCHALFWYRERCIRDSRVGQPVYNLCCRGGRVHLPAVQPTPSPLSELLDPLNGPDSRHFLECIRIYNSMFAFTSMGVQVDESINRGHGPYVYRISGQLCHLIGSLLPDSDTPPQFAQLYIYDTENEISNRLGVFSVSDQSSAPRPHIVEALRDMLDAYNPYAQAFRSVRDRVLDDFDDSLRLRIISHRSGDGRQYAAPTASEVVGLMVGDIDDQHFDRDIILQRRTGSLQRISSLHPSYMPSQYPLLFVHGEDSFHLEIQYRVDDSATSSRVRQHVTMNEYYCYRLHVRAIGCNIILRSGRLLQQISVDMFACVDQSRVNYIHNNQASLRSDTYMNIRNAVIDHDVYGRNVGRRIILPPSHTGGPRYMFQNYQDAIAVCRHLGPPHLFITFTCNPAWPEITRNLFPGQQPSDRPDLVSRVFKMKLNQMTEDIRGGEFFGPVSGLIHSVEFQKRGLPHVHIIVWLLHQNSLSDGAAIDHVISAELPDPDIDPDAYSLVSQFMVHGPCGPARPRSPCMQNGNCSKHFPKRFHDATLMTDDGVVLYRRRDQGITVEKNGVVLDNRYVVPYNLNLLFKYRAHINVERCHTSIMIKYLFKYICKGRDRARVSIQRNAPPASSNSAQQNQSEQIVDEILDYLDCRYLTPHESIWRLFQYHIHYSYPSVERLPIHLPLENNVVFHDSQSLQQVASNPIIQRTKLTAWFELNAADATARNLTYPEVTRLYTWHDNGKFWQLRQSGYRLARMAFIPPGAGEAYFVRTLLNCVRGARSFTELRTVNGTIYPTFKEACNALGLLEDNSEWLSTMQEAAAVASSGQLRRIFVDMLLYSEVADARQLWDSCWPYMGDDIVHRIRSNNNNFEMTVDTDILKDHILYELEDILFERGYSLQYVRLPSPLHPRTMHPHNRLLTEQYSFNTVDLRMRVPTLLAGLNADQKIAFDMIVQSTMSRSGKFFFVYGHGGTGKTFLWRVLTAYLRSNGKIVLTVASSGLSSLLLEGGVTAYYRFKIPIKLKEGTTCDIKKHTHLAHLLLQTSLIVWDEAPMNNKLCFEALDRTMRDIFADQCPNNQTKPFGGVTVVLGGDFRQTLPVIPHGNRFDTVSASITNSYLWPSCHLIKLTINMRLLPSNQSSADRHRLAAFATWLLSVGDGTAPTMTLYNSTEPNWIHIPDEYLIHPDGDPEHAMIDAVYPNFEHEYQNETYLQQRAIITPKNAAVALLNDVVLQRIPGQQHDYYSYDSAIGRESLPEDLQTMFTSDMLNTIISGSMPSHKLSLKIGVPVMLLRNMDQLIMDNLLQVSTLTLTTETQNAKIHGRAVRIWPASDPRRGRVWKFHFLFIDHTGSKIQGFILTTDYQRVGHVFTEQNLIEITKFAVDESSQDYKVVDYDYMLKITRQTQVKMLPAPMYALPTYYFDFKQLEDVGTEITYEKAVLDTIARLSGFSDVKTVPSLDNVRVQTIYLTNESTPFDGQPIVLNATPGMFNRAAPPLALLPKKPAIRITIQDLNALYLDNYTETYYQSAIRITRVTDPFDWFYEACPDCHKMLDRDGQAFYCPDCRTKKRQFIPWYRIKIQVADHTGTAQFVLLGKTAAAIVGADPGVLKTEQDNTNKPPQALLDIVNKTYLFTVSGKQPGPKRKYRTYTVSRQEPVPDDMIALLPDPILLLQDSPHAQQQSPQTPKTPPTLQDEGKSASTTPPPEPAQAEILPMKRSPVQEASDNTKDGD
ncbi:hypothetical protein LUZ61_011630 [Rhynchospora tenuis]|uniref:ATP-dependent DNA helicase n=1 Tax=Rhynchospora tenuis TaxID=198213 RepID=A0AAD6A1I1_9POAL|nr:hypothetical protein LUZ61_011630 [Rhynchospora tenuis]